MTDLERRALLGDRQAQEECTRQGIALRCPCCGAPMVKEAGWFYHPNVMCILGLKFFRITDIDLISMWNHRPAPPIGRCKDCAHSSPRMVMGNKTYGKVCKIDPYLVHEVNPDGYCDGFKPKEAPNG